MTSGALRLPTLLAWVAACGHHAAEPTRHPLAAKAQFAVDIPSTRVASRDDLRAHFVLTNTGDVPLWLNGRMLLGAGRSSSPFNEVWVDARGPGKIAWWCYLKTPEVTPEHYRLLAPGDSVGREQGGPSEDLRCLGLDEPGTYTLIGHYKDGNEGANIPPAPSGSVYLGWEVVSEPITVEITQGSRNRPPRANDSP